MPASLRLGQVEQEGTARLGDHVEHARSMTARVVPNEPEQLDDKTLSEMIHDEGSAALKRCNV